MKKSRLFCATCACVFGLAASSSAWAALVTPTLITHEHFSFDDATVSSSTSTQDTFIALYDNSFIISEGLAHSIDNTDGLSTSGCCDIAQTSIDALFTANIDATYSINGFYGMLGPAGTTILFDAFLEDLTTSTLLFRDFSISTGTANESLVLGVIAEGDTDSSNIGSLAGNLIAGHDYRFFFDSFIQAYDGSVETAVAATATGNVTLNISSVPIPGAVWLFGAGLLGLVGVARRKKV